MAIYSLHHSAIGRTTHDPGTAGAHVRYIARQSAARLVLSERMPGDPIQARAWLDEQEQAERKNGRVIDKVMVALPCELTPEQRAVLVREFAAEATQGRASWLAAIHDQGKDAANPHAHIVIRDKDPETGKRVAKLSEKGSTERLREAWERAANHALERAGQEARIDRRSLKDQGIERTPQIHVGPRAKAMEARGVRPESQERCDHRGRVIPYPKIDRDVMLKPRTRAEHNAKIIKINEIKAAQKAQAQKNRENWVAEREAERRAEEAARRARVEEYARKRAQEAEEARKAEEARREREEDQRLQEARERTSADRYEALLRAHQDAEQAASGAAWQRNQWIEANPWRARLHRWGVLEARPLVEIEGRIEAVKTAQEALQRDPLGRLAYEAREATRRQQEAAQREAERVQREQQRQLERQQRRERQQERGQKPSKDRGGMDFGM